MPSTTRRAVLGALGAGSLAALAGCSSSCPDSGRPEPDALVQRDAASPFDDVPGTDWPAPRNDAGNTGYAPDATLPESPLGVRWEATLPTADSDSTYDRASSPAVAGDRVVVATGGGVSALRFRDGAEAWRVGSVTPNTTPSTRGYDQEYVPPVVAGGDTVLVGGEDGLVALALEDGSERWRYEGATSFRTPAVHDGTVYAGSGDGVVAVDAADGTELWTQTVGVDAGLPAVADGAVVVTDDETVALEAASGETRWRSQQRSDRYPVAADGTAYLGSYEGLAAVDLASGEVRWTFDRGGGRSLSPPVVADDTLYLVEQPGEASDATFALDLTDDGPDPRWCSEVGEGAVTAATDDSAVGLLPGGNTTGPRGGSVRMVAFDEQLGAARWGLPARDELLAPAVVDGAVVAVDRTGVVRAVGAV